MRYYPKAKSELRTFIFLLKNKRYAFVYDFSSFAVSIEKEPEEIFEYQPYIDRLNKLTLLLAVQEKTNRADAYMFGKIIEELLETDRDIFKIISRAGFGGRRS